jgi:hypothetical protein
LPKKCSLVCALFSLVGVDVLKQAGLLDDVHAW